MPRASRHSRRPSPPNCFISSISSARCRSRDDAKAALHQLLLGRRADAVDEADRLVAPASSRASSWSSAAKPRGLSRSEAILARNLLQDRPTETVMPMSRSTSRAKRASTLAGIMPCTRCGAGQIEKRLVDRQRLDQRRQRLHGVAHLAADADIFRHVGPDHGGLRAQRQRLEHRHRRAHAIGARDVAGGRHHAALAAADDHRPVGQLRIVALLDGGVERVAVDMRQRQRGQRVVADQARGAACAAPPGLDIEVAEAIPAEARGPSSAGAGALTARRAPSAGRPAPGARRRCWSDAVARRSAKAFTVASSRITKSSTLSQKLRVGRRPCAASPGRCRFRPGTGPAARGRRQ